MKNAIQENPTLTLAINGMNCGSCVGRVQRALTAVSGVSDAVVDLKANNATIRYDPVTVGIEDLKAAVTSAGYEIAENDPKDLKAVTRHLKANRQREAA